MNKITTNINQNSYAKKIWQFADPNTTEITLLIILIAISIYPIWATTYIPTTDGPVHLENALILKSLISGEKGIFSNFFHLTSGSYTNYAVYLIYIGLNHFANLYTAEKILLSLYIISLPLSIRYAVCAINPKNSYLAFLSLPMLYNTSLNFGFYNFILSLPFMFCSIGYWSKHNNSFNYSNALKISMLILITYLFHPLSFAILAIIITTTEILLIIKKHHGFKSLKDNRLHICKRLLTNTSLFIPSIIFACLFISKEGSVIKYTKSLATRLYALAGLSSLISFNHLEAIKSYTVVSLLIVLILLCSKAKIKAFISNTFFLSVVVVLFLYFFIPDEISNGSMVNIRMQLFVIFSVLLFISNLPFDPIAKKTTISACFFLCLFSTLITFKDYADLSKGVETYLSTSSFIKSNSTVLSVSLDSRSPSIYIQPFVHVASHLAYSNKAVELNNFQATQSYFPINYNLAINPYSYLGEIESKIPKININNYTQVTGVKIDYIIIWGRYDDKSANSELHGLLDQINTLYDLVYTNNSNFNVALFRLKHSNKT
jgi:hypothetical protein